MSETAIQADVLKAFDEASKTLRAIVNDEIGYEPGLVAAGESTIRVPMLEVDPGATSVSLVFKPEPFLDERELNRLREVAAWRGGSLRFGSSEDGIVTRIVFRSVFVGERPQTSA